MASLASDQSRRQPNRKNTPKLSSNNPSSNNNSSDTNGSSFPSPRQIQHHHDNLTSRASCPHRIIFLMESTAYNTKYIDIYKDAVKHCGGTADDPNVIFIDHDHLVDTLDYKCVEKDDAYRLLHERAKTDLLNNNGNMTVSLMILLVRHSLVLALESVQHKWNVVTNDITKSTLHIQPPMTRIILTNFFDLAFITQFIASKVKVEAIVKVNCRKIAQVRDKFVSKASAAKWTAADKKIQKFWRDLRGKLDTVDGSFVFKDVVMYDHESRYNTYYEPLNFDKIIEMSRRYTVREMSRVQDILLDVETEYGNYMHSANLTYALNINQDYTYYFDLYSQHLSKLPEDVVSVPVILDAMIKTIDPEKLTSEHIDFLFDSSKYNEDGGCINYNVCIQYGNDCALSVKKHNLRSTNYLQSVVSVLKVRWRMTLWGARPLLPLQAEAAYAKMISRIKSLCDPGLVAGDDVDVQLCVLALNRLQNNLDVFRGEKMGWPGLRAAGEPPGYRPELVEPIDCVTMVQALDSESENYRQTSYAYFEPEDVVLVVFYNFPDVAPSRRSSFRYNAPQRPLYTKDYFQYFYGERTPRRFYAIDVARQLCPAYRERTDEVRFADNDGSLTVINRKWRFEPDTVCLVYRAKRYEIIRHVWHGSTHKKRRKYDVVDGDNDDDDLHHDRFKISYPGRAEYFVDKSSRGVIGFVGKTADDDVCTEIVSGGGGYCLFRQSTSDPDREEYCRRYGNGRVVVDMPDKSTVTYRADGKVESDSTMMVAHLPPVKQNESNVSKMAPSRIKTSRSARSTRGGGGGVSSGSTGMVRRPSKLAPRRNNHSTTHRSYRYISTVASDDDTDAAVTEYTYGGSVRTVEFEDGTRITTYIREVQCEPDWVCLAISGYKYDHPVYGQTTEERNRTFSVPGLITRSADGSLRLSLDKDGGHIKVTSNAVEVYGARRPDDDDDDDDDEGSKIATFGWKDSKLLFDKLDGRGSARRRTRVTYDGAVNHTPAPATGTVATVGQSTPPSNPSAHAYFIVKRNMSGFRVLDGRQYNEFAEEIRDLTHTIVHENHDEIVALSVVGDTKKPSATDANGYGWLTVFSGQKSIDRNIAFSSKLLTSRTFRRVSVDYGPVLDALLQQPKNDVSGAAAAVAADNRTASAVPRLAVRINVLDYETVQAMYARGLCGSACRHVSARDSRFAETLLIRRVGLSARLAQQNEHNAHTLEARTRMRRNSFIPFFRYDNYEPLRKYIVANNLSHPA